MAEQQFHLKEYLKVITTGQIGRIDSRSYEKRLLHLASSKTLCALGNQWGT